MNLSVITEKVKSVWDFLKQRRNIVLTLFFLLLLPVTLLAVRYQQNLNSQAAVSSGEIQIYNTFNTADIAGEGNNPNIAGGEIGTRIVRLHVILPDWSQASIPHEQQSSLASSVRSAFSLPQARAQSVEGCADADGRIDSNPNQTTVCTDFKVTCFDGSGTRVSDDPTCNACDRQNAHYWGSCPSDSNDPVAPQGTGQQTGPRCADADGRINNNPNQNPVCTDFKITCFDGNGNAVNTHDSRCTNPAYNCTAVNAHYWEVCPVSSTTSSSSTGSVSSQAGDPICDVNDQSLCAQEGAKGLYCRQLSTELQGRWMTQTEALDACTKQATTGVQYALTPCSDSNLKTKHVYLCENGEYRAATETDLRNRGLAIANPGGGGAVCCFADSDCGGGTCDTQTTSTVSDCGSYPAQAAKPHLCRSGGSAGTVGGQQPTVVPTNAPGNRQEGESCSDSFPCAGGLACVARSGADRNDKVCKPSNQAAIFTQQITILNNIGGEDIQGNAIDISSSQIEAAFAGANENNSVQFVLAEYNQSDPNDYENPNNPAHRTLKIPSFALPVNKDTTQGGAEKQKRKIYVQFKGSNGLVRYSEATITLVAYEPTFPIVGNMTDDGRVVVDGKPTAQDTDASLEAGMGFLKGIMAKLGKTIDTSNIGDGVIGISGEGQMQLGRLKDYPEIDLRNLAYELANLEFKNETTGQVEKLNIYPYFAMCQYLNDTPEDRAKLWRAIQLSALDMPSDIITWDLDRDPGMRLPVGTPYTRPDGIPLERKGSAGITYPCDIARSSSTALFPRLRLIVTNTSLNEQAKRNAIKELLESQGVNGPMLGRYFVSPTLEEKDGYEMILATFIEVLRIIRGNTTALNDNQKALTFQELAAATSYVFENSSTSNRLTAELTGLAEFMRLGKQGSSLKQAFEDTYIVPTIGTEAMLFGFGSRAPVPKAPRVALTRVGDKVKTQAPRRVLAQGARDATNKRLSVVMADPANMSPQEMQAFRALERTNKGLVIYVGTDNETLQKLFGKFLGQGGLGRTFGDYKNKILTKVFRADGVGQIQNEFQAQFYATYSGRGGLDTFYEYIYDHNERMIGYRTSFFENAVSMANLLHLTGNSLHDRDAYNLVVALQKIHIATGHAHGDLTFSGGKVGKLSTNNVIVRCVDPSITDFRSCMGSLDWHIIDYAGNVPNHLPQYRNRGLELLTDRNFMAEEYDLFKQLVYQYVQR